MKDIPPKQLLRLWRCKCYALGAGFSDNGASHSIPSLNPNRSRNERKRKQPKCPIITPISMK